MIHLPLKAFFLKQKFWVTIILLLVIHAGIAFSTARKLSVTHDEYWHLPIGLLSWKTARFDYDVINPPLIRVWGTAPLLLTDADIKPMPVAPDASAYGNAFLNANLENHHHYFVMGRSMIIMLSVATGLLMAVWARQLFGEKAVLLVVAIWSFSPNILAHASLMTHDLAAAGFFLATLYAGWRFALNPSWQWSIITGVVIGLALLTKYTSLLLPPLLLVYWVIIRFRNSEIDRSCSVNQLFKKWGLLLVVSLLMLNMGYLFSGIGDSLSDYQFQSTDMQKLSHLPVWIQSVPLPLPHDYITGFDRLRFFMEQRHPSYLNYEWSIEGWRKYYAMALLFKLPHAVQLLLLATLFYVIFSFRNSTSHLRRTQFLLLIPFVSLVTIASLSGNQLGLRYILPVFPCLFLMVAQIAETINFQTNRIYSICLMVLIAIIPLSTRHHPEHLAYFNELAGGPIGGRAHLVDSNLDWGQDLWAVKEYVQQHHLKDVSLAYFGSVPPASEGITYHLPPASPQVGLHIISVNFVQGRPHSIRQPNGEVFHAGIETFRYFRFFDPIDHLGASIDVYNLTSDDIANWNKQQHQ